MLPDDDQRPVKLGYAGNHVPWPIRWMWIAGLIAAAAFLLLLWL